MYSGIEWLGEIPKHWELKPIKYLVEIDSEKLSDSADPDLELEYIDIGNVDSNGNILNREPLKFEDAPSRARRVIKQGDTILATVRTYLRAIAHIDYEFENLQVCSTGFAVLRPVSIDPRFLYYWTRSDYFIAEVVSRSVGVSYPAISSSEVGNLIIPDIPLPEQEAIATFLDHQTTRIDQLIEKKKRILDLLDEQRQATITRAVTKGIEPHAKMKDSGIEWLGEVPEHWEFKPIKYLVDIDSEKLKDSEDPDLELEYIDIGSVDSEGNINNKESMRFEKAPSRARRVVKKGDTILATVRTYLKAIAYIDYDFNTLQICSTGFAVLRPKEVLPRFLFYWVRSDYFIGEIVSRSVGVSYPAISSSEIGNLPIPDLAVDEQKQIASLIDNEIVRIDRIKEKIKTAIELLTEYRSSLITQAVTGKIDVRDEVSEQELSYAAEEGESYTTN